MWSADWVFFHLIMSFLGSVDSVMCSFGLTEALECCYGPNIVVQMMHGKAVARSLRGHFMVDSALWILLLQTLLDLDNVSHIGSLTHADISELRAVYDNVVAHNPDLSEQLPECLVKLHMNACDQKVALASQSRTAKLWIQYLTYVDILRCTIRAERTSDWNLHLVAVSKMLNLFAASGHNHYAKCALCKALPADDDGTATDTSKAV